MHPEERLFPVPDHKEQELAGCPRPRLFPAVPASSPPKDEDALELDVEDDGVDGCGRRGGVNAKEGVTGTSDDAEGGGEAGEVEGVPLRVPEIGPVDGDRRRGPAVCRGQPMEEFFIQND